MSKKPRDELGKLVFDLNHFSVTEQEKGIDEVWGKIIHDVHEYEERERYEWYYGYKPVFDFSIEQSERPDIIYQCADFVMGIEYFEFDASKEKKKGSTQKQKEAEVDRLIDKEHRQLTPSKDGLISIEKPVDVEFSITSYLESLSSAFRSHADTIAAYRQNLTEKAQGKRVLLSFYIEDVTAVGNYVVVDGKQEALDPLRIPAFLNLLASVQGLDYVITKTTFFYVPSLRIQPVSISALSQLISSCYGPNDKYVQYQYKRQSHFWRLGDKNA